MTINTQMSYFVDLVTIIVSVLGIINTKRLGKKAMPSSQNPWSPGQPHPNTSGGYTSWKRSITSSD